MYSAMSIANAFIDLSLSEGRPLTHLQIQKLVYIAQGYHLAITGDPLYHEDIMAWPYGPVTPALYKKLKRFGRNKVTETIALNDSVLSIKGNNFVCKLIETVYSGYKHYTGSQLSTITHQPNTPWAVTWHRLRFSPIDHDLIESHYKELLPSDDATK